MRALLLLQVFSYHNICSYLFILSLWWRNLILISVKEHNCTFAVRTGKVVFYAGVIWEQIECSQCASRSVALILSAECVHCARLFIASFSIQRLDAAETQFCANSRSAHRKRQKWWNGTIIAAPVACNPQISKVGCKEKLFHCFTFVWYFDD